MKGDIAYKLALAIIIFFISFLAIFLLLFGNIIFVPKELSSFPVLNTTDVILRDPEWQVKRIIYDPFTGKDVDICETCENEGRYCKSWLFTCKEKSYIR